MADEKIKEIIVSDTGFSGYIAKFNTNCMSKGDIDWPITCVPSNEGDTGCACEWVHFGFGTNTVDATVDPNDTGNQRECVFQITYKTSESTGCTKQFKIVQGSVTPEPPEPPEPDPKPENCVTPLDNIGRDCTGSKTAIQEFIDAKYVGCEGNKWWSGPINSHDDVGVGIKGEGDNPGDGIRCTPTNLRLEPSSSWIHYTIDSNAHEEFKGWVHYTIDANPSSSPRSGTVKVTLIEPENTDREWEGKPAETPFCMGGNGAEMYVYVYQRGNSSPTTCTLDVKGNESSSLPPIPAEGATSFVKVGTYETDCEGNWGTPTLSSGVDFVTAWEFRDDGGVYAKASENTGEARSTKYNVTKGDANNDFTVDQDGTGTTECTCSNAGLSITGKTIDCAANTRVLVATYISDCDLESPDNYGHVTGDSIVNQTGPGQYEFSNGSIYMPVSENPSSGQRSEVYQFCDERFTITQLGKCTITDFQVDPTVTRDGVELGGTVKYHLNICDAGCDEEIEIKFHNNGKVAPLHPSFTSTYISGSFWVEPTVWAVGDAYFEVVVKGETKEYHFEINPQS